MCESRNLQPHRALYWSIHKYHEDKETQSVKARDNFEDGEKSKEEVDQENEKRDSSLFFAAQSGFLDLVKSLLSEGANPDNSSNRNTSCLMAAFKGGHHKVVDTLVDKVKNFPSDVDMRLCLSPRDNLNVQCGRLKSMEIIRKYRDRVVEQENEKIKTSTFVHK